MNIKLDLNNSDHRSLQPMEYDQPESIAKSPVWQMNVPMPKAKHEDHFTPIPGAPGFFYAPYIPLFRDPQIMSEDHADEYIHKFVKAYNGDLADNPYWKMVKVVPNEPEHETVTPWWQTMEKPVESSALDAVNSRRLMLQIREVLSELATHMLFEFNDDETRKEFRTEAELYLEELAQRGAIYDYRVVCDRTNNPPEIIDANQFTADIYIRPTQTINYIQLNFVATRMGVDFDEIVGDF